MQKSLITKIIILAFWPMALKSSDGPTARKNAVITKIKIYAISFDIRFNKAVTISSIRDQAEIIIEVPTPDDPLDSLNHFFQLIEETPFMLKDTIRTTSGKFNFPGIRMLAILYPKKGKPIKIYIKRTKTFLIGNKVYKRNDKLLEAFFFYLADYYKPAPFK